MTNSALNGRRIAVFLANPDPERPLDTDKEWCRIDDAISRSRHRSMLEVVPYKRPTRDDLHRAVLDGFDVIHVASHGRKDGIELHTHGGGRELVSLQELSELLSGHGPAGRPVQCSVLNACWSSEIGTRQALRVPYTIAMEEEIADTAAIDFAAGFYDALGAGQDFIQSFHHGRLRGDRGLNEPFRPILLESKTGVLGIRSFTYDAEDLDRQTECILLLEGCFEGRRPKSPHSWASIVEEVSKFCRDGALRQRFRHEEFSIHLSCHLSIALLAGHLFGFEAPVVPLQGRHRKQAWRRSQTSPPTVALARKSRGRPEAHDLAISLSIARDIADDVESHLRSDGRDFHLVDLSMGPGNPRSVADGEHADAIAEQIVREIRLARAGHPERLVHLFVAAPVALMFLLGQHQYALGRLRLYDFDYTHEATASYSPSFEIPLTTHENK